MSAVYNEIDAYAAQWLRNLISGELIAPGTVDERDVRDVRPDEIGDGQFHAFAGIGIWSAACRAAGVPDDFPVWTVSCPCQSFSQAGQRRGFADERHLWPYWLHLAEQRRPAVVFGEQVASRDGLAWLDLVQADMEGLGYACGAAVIPAAGFGAPHGRHRIMFVAYAKCRGREGWGKPVIASHGGYGGAAGVLVDAEGEQARVSRRARERRATAGFWAGADWIPCRDDKWRAVEPGTFPLAAGYPRRVEQLRAYGNSLCLPAATEFVRAYLEYVE